MPSSRTWPRRCWARSPRAGTATCTGCSSSPGPQAPDEVITEATPNVDAMACSSFLYNLAFHRPWYEVQFGGVLGIENQIHRRTPGWSRASRRTTPTCSLPTTTAFHTIHIYVDEDHGGGVGAFAEHLDTEEKRRDARVAYLTGAELTRRCWDALDGATW